MTEEGNNTYLAQLKEWMMVFIIIGFIAVMGNVIGYDFGFFESIPGMLILIVISVLGLSLNYIIPYKIPTVIYVSLLGLLVALPWSPISDFVLNWVNRIDLMALATPILAYAGVVVGRDWKDFRKVGWRGLIVALLVIIGTFLVSGGIAEVMMRLFY